MISINTCPHLGKASLWTPERHGFVALAARPKARFPEADRDQPPPLLGSFRTSALGEGACRRWGAAHLSHVVAEPPRVPGAGAHLVRIRNREPQESRMNTDITTPVSKTDWPSLLDLLGAGDVSLDENFRILFCSAGGPGALVRLRGSE